jgi:hypothetical protein
MAISISMVMLKSDEPMRLSDIQKQLAEFWPDLPAATDAEEKDNSVAFRLGASQIIIGKMPVPIPWADLEGPCATSVLWRNAEEEVKQHTIHWIVTVNDDFDPVKRLTLLTQVTAAAMAACPVAMGVYWGAAPLIIPKNVFIDFARKVMPQGPPLHVWVDFRVGKDSDHTSSGFTAGMKALGHMEFETQNAPELPSELRERLLALAGYVLEHGPVLRDGDSVGRDAAERIRVVYSESAFGHEGQVMRLQYESASPKKPWWKPW